MRTRDLRPGFFKNERLGECPPIVRLAYAGIWTVADREGRLADRPRRLAAELFPYDVWPDPVTGLDFNAALAMLAGKGFISRYSADGIDVIEIRDFKNEQNIHPKETPSVLPGNPRGKLATENDQPRLATESNGKQSNYTASYSFPSTPSVPSTPSITSLVGGDMGGSLGAAGAIGRYPQGGLVIPIHGGGQFSLSGDEISNLQAEFPTLDVWGQLLRMFEFWQGKPDNERPAPRSMDKSIRRWLTEESGKAAAAALISATAARLEAPGH